MTRVVVVPSTLLLLPRYAGLEDPVAELRAACERAVSWLVDGGAPRVTLLSTGRRPVDERRGVDEPAGIRIGRHLLRGHGVGERDEFRVSQLLHPALPGSVPERMLVVANGTATRSERAPGHLDDRSLEFDADVGRALAAGDPGALAGLDAELGEQLWCHDVPVLQWLGELLGGRTVRAEVDYDDDSFGVRYWVTRWSCES